MKIRKIDLSGLNPLIKECKFTVMCDVTNPLCGKDGATYTFGRQKGATPEIQNDLEAGMCNYRDIIKEQFDLDMDNIPGSGAAGGLGTALMVFHNRRYLLHRFPYFRQSLQLVYGAFCSVHQLPA